MDKVNVQVALGNLKIGKGYPVRIKGMLKKSLEDKRALLREAMDLQREGAEAIRMAIKTKGQAKIVSFLKKKIKVPLVADIHFDEGLALEAIARGFEGVRLNPLNLTNKNKLTQVIKEARKNNVHIRVGINSGGFRQVIEEEELLGQKMVEKALDFIRLLEEENFFNLSVSLKASSLKATLLANRLFAKSSSYPLHLGITATGPFLEGIVKSAMGIGILLEEGIGSILRVSLNAESFWEVRVAKYILQGLNLRRFSPEIISCPTCARCQVDLKKIVEDFKVVLERLEKKRGLLSCRIALMGCEVNGPGEAYQADLGLAFGKGKACLFKKGKILNTLPTQRALRELLKIIEKEYKKGEYGCKFG